MLHERTFVADFTPPVANIPRGMLVNSDNPPLDLTLFVRPFTRSSWVAVAGCVALLVPALLFFPRGRGGPEPGRDRHVVRRGLKERNYPTNIASVNLVISYNKVFFPLF